MAKTKKRRSASKAHATRRAAGHPVPGLTGPILQFDLAAETAQLRQEESWQSTSRNAKTLVKYPDFRVVLILMKAGTRMAGHKAEGSISVQTLTGLVRMHLADKAVEVPAGHLLTLERALPHEVEAVSESSFLLSISWPRGATQT